MLTPFILALSPVSHSNSALHTCHLLQVDLSLWWMQLEDKLSITNKHTQKTWILGYCLETALRKNLQNVGTKSNKTMTSSHAEAPFPIMNWSFWNQISTGKNMFAFRHYFQILFGWHPWYFKSEFNPQGRVTFKISPKSLHLGFSLLNMPPKVVFLKGGNASYCSHQLHQEEKGIRTQNSEKLQRLVS